MNKTILSLAAISALAVSSFAANDLASAFKEGKISGDIRAMYFQDDFKPSATKDLSSTAIGGKLKFETAPLYGVSMGVSVYTTQALNGTGAGAVPSMFDGSTGNKGYTILGEAYLLGTYGKTTVKVGRQQIDTPLAGSDDIRMIPNLFDAALVINTDLPDTTLIGGYVARMAGLDSLYGTGAQYATFKSMSASALGATTANAVGVNNDGVYVAAVVNNSIKDLTAQAWYYSAQEVLNAYYLQADYKLGALTLSGQYYNLDDTGKTATALTTAGTPLNYSVYGAKAAYAFDSIGLTPYVAYDAFSKKDNGIFVAGAWGGYPEFAQMEEWFSNSASIKPSDLKITKVGADYSLEKLGLGARTFSLAYGNFNYSKAANNNVDKDTKIYDAILNCDSTLLKNLSTRIAYERVDSKDNTIDQNIAKVIFNYNF